jgi:hypothetical protein
VLLCHLALRRVERESDYPEMDGCVNQIWIQAANFFATGRKKSRLGGFFVGCEVLAHHSKPPSDRSDSECHEHRDGGVFYSVHDHDGADDNGRSQAEPHGDKDCQPFAGFASVFVLRSAGWTGFSFVADLVPALRATDESHTFPCW